MTVESALCGVAGLRPGERVLVHAAAGGVGLAAMQVGVINIFSFIFQSLFSSVLEQTKGVKGAS